MLLERKKKEGERREKYLVVPLRGTGTHTHTTFQFWGQVESQILPPNFKLKVVWQERTMEKLLISPCSHSVLKSAGQTKGMHIS